jgi:hypothetical protein
MIRYFGRTMSGRPGRSRICRRNRKPSLCSAFLTSISGSVSFDRIRDIIAERAAAVSPLGVFILRPLENYQRFHRQVIVWFPSCVGGIGNPGSDPLQGNQYRRQPGRYTIAPLELLRPALSLARTRSPHKSTGAEALKDSGQKDLWMMSAFGPGGPGRRVAQLRGNINRGASSPWG